MGMQINTNVSALNTYRNLTATQNSLSKSLEKLSSGLRINRASDDAAGLTIAEGLKSQIGGLQVASRNAQDGISVVQVAEGALGEAQSILQRLRDLAVQAGNDSNSTDARTAIKTEATSLVSELTRIGDSVNFNGKKLLDGSASDMKFQIGADGNAQSQISVDLSSANLKGIATTLGTGSGATATKYSGMTDPADAAGNTLSFTSAVSGSSTTVDVAVGASVDSYQELVDGLNGDADFSGKFTASVTVDANNVPDGFSVVARDGGTVSLDSASITALSATETSGSAATGIAFGSATEAQAAVNLIANALNTVSTERSKLGALQNRFESAINTINVSVENLSASKSRITDVDMASEMVNFTRANILSQSGTAMLAQANQAPQLALKLLG
jgi:flagellin